jgi:hypothetical protein
MRARRWRSSKLDLIEEGVDGWLEGGQGGVVGDDEGVDVAGGGGEEVVKFGPGRAGVGIVELQDHPVAAGDGLVAFGNEVGRVSHDSESPEDLVPELGAVLGFGVRGHGDLDRVGGGVGLAKFPGHGLVAAGRGSANGREEFPESWVEADAYWRAGNHFEGLGGGRLALLQSEVFVLEVGDLTAQGCGFGAQS